MANRTKSGLDYFPLDVDFFQDLKIRKIIRVYGDSAQSNTSCRKCNRQKKDKSVDEFIKWRELN